MPTVNDANGQPANITDDGQLRTISVVQTDLNYIGTLGRAWTLPFTQTGAANTTDNTVFNLKNTSDDEIEIMRLVLSSAEAGLWSLEYGRERTSGGTAVLLRQMNTLSGKTQSVSAFFGTALTMTGSATDNAYVRVGADAPFDILNYGPVILEPSATMSIRFQADTGSNVMAVTPFMHGSNPFVKD
jgi:hypothetical protein